MNEMTIEYGDISWERIIQAVHSHDLINIGLVTSDWTSKFPRELAARLQELLDDPNERV